MSYINLYIAPTNALNFIKITTHWLLHVSVLIGPSPGSTQLYQNRCLTFSACTRAVVNSSVCNIYIYIRSRTSCALKTVIGAACCSGFRDTKVSHLAKAKRRSSDQQSSWTPDNIEDFGDIIHVRFVSVRSNGRRPVLFLFPDRRWQRRMPRTPFNTNSHSYSLLRSKTPICNIPVRNTKNKFTKNTCEKHSFTNSSLVYMYVWHDITDYRVETCDNKHGVSCHLALDCITTSIPC